MASQCMTSHKDAVEEPYRHSREYPSISLKVSENDFIEEGRETVIAIPDLTQLLNKS